MRTIFSRLILCAGCLLLATPSWATRWTMIAASDQRWWIDLDSISVNSDQGVTFFKVQMSDAEGVPPDDTQTQYGIAAVDQAIDCKTGQEYNYNHNYDDAGNEHGAWSKDLSKWPPEYRASVKQIVCGN